MEKQVAALREQIALLDMSASQREQMQLLLKDLDKQAAKVDFKIESLAKSNKGVKRLLSSMVEELEDSKNRISHLFEELTDSLNYAKMIQEKFLANTETFNQHFEESFVFFQPKDIVSGDFYWSGTLSNGNFAILIGDSTGHGVPGAIMSILNISAVEKAIHSGLTAPAALFNAARTTIIDRMNKADNAEGGSDGMDAVMLSFDFEQQQFQYVAAQNPIWIVRAGRLIEIKPEKMPVGKHFRAHMPFEGGSFPYQKGDVLYLLSDGFQDQFGGPKGKKFMVKALRELLVSIADQDLVQQREVLQQRFESWKGDVEQVDDVCIVGFRL